MWEKADNTNIDELSDIFWDNILDNPIYISHGEIQMGVATDVGVPADNGKEKWKQYIVEKINNYSQLPATVLVYKKNGVINAFCILEISKDGAEPFGVICDMLVKKEMRGKGFGKQMLANAMEWFDKMGVKDIYLESGVDNHSAHDFFNNYGFSQVSHIFRLQR